MNYKKVKSMVQKVSKQKKKKKYEKFVVDAPILLLKLFKLLLNITKGHFNHLSLPV